MKDNTPWKKMIKNTQRHYICKQEINILIRLLNNLKLKKMKKKSCINSKGI